MDGLRFPRHKTEQELEIGKCYKVNRYTLAYIAGLKSQGIVAYFLHHGKACQQLLTYRNLFEPCELPTGYDAVIAKIDRTEEEV